jgi:hypothetical protein
MSCSDRIVRVKYPKGCLPEPNESNGLIYSGPPLACIDGQSDTAFSDIIKNLDTLLCETIDKLRATTTTTTTLCLNNECWYNGGIVTRKYLCVSIKGGGRTFAQPASVFNSKPRYDNITIGSVDVYIEWSNTNNRWELYVDTGTFNGLYAVLNSTSFFPVSDPNAWTCVASTTICTAVGEFYTGDTTCVPECNNSGGTITIGGCQFGTLTCNTCNFGVVIATV